MSNVLTFTQRPKPAVPEAQEPLAGAELRAQIEAGVQAAIDLADHYIAVLNQMDGDADFEDGADAEPSLAAPENTGGSQVTWLRGNDQDREIETADAPLPGPEGESLPEAAILPWRGRGNVIAAAGVLLLDLLERA